MCNDQNNIDPSNYQLIIELDQLIIQYPTKVMMLIMWCAANNTGESSLSLSLKWFNVVCGATAVSITQE